MDALENLDSDDLLARLKTGDEQAARIVFARYTARLAALVSSRLASRFQSRMDPDDVVASAWRSFFGGARDQRWTTSDGDLWPLLAALTMRKLFRQVRRHQGMVRDVRRQESPIGELTSSLLMNSSPDSAAVLSAAETLEAALEALEPLEREVLVLRLRGDSLLEIAALTGSSERSVGRAFAAACESIKNTLAAAQEGHELEPLLEAVRQRFNRDVDEADAEPQRAFESIKSIRRFHFSELMLQKMIGQGGVGRVYRAVERGSNQKVAVKFLKKRFWDDRRAIQSLIIELTAVSQTNIPGAVHPGGWGRTPSGTPFLVSELIDGQDLMSWAQAERPDRMVVLTVLAEGAEILASVHAAGLIHGDVTPGNLIREFSGRVRLTDFGMSCRTASQRSFFQGGTLGYLAPEQWNPAFGSIGPWTDVYGLAATAVALLTGVPPHQKPTRSETIAALLCSEEDFRLAPGLPLEEMLTACLQRDICRRPASMLEIALRLRSTVS